MTKLSKTIPVICGKKQITEIKKYTDTTEILHKYYKIQTLTSMHRSRKRSNVFDSSLHRRHVTVCTSN